MNMNFRLLPESSERTKAQAADEHGDDKAEFIIYAPRNGSPIRNAHSALGQKSVRVCARARTWSAFSAPIDSIVKFFIFIAG